MGFPEISPMPPVAGGVGLPWDLPVDNAVDTLARARTDHGDTFVVDSGDDRYLFTFSPQGVSAFYALPEDKAAKGVADWRMLRRKIPDEVFVGRRTLPHELFGREDVACYLANVDRALDSTFEEMGSGGAVDVFDLTRRLGHRIGMASWGGPGSADGPVFSQLALAFDTLDGSDSFVHPDAMAAVTASGKAAERAALQQVGQLLGCAIDLLAGSEGDHPLFSRIVSAWADESGEAMRIGVAHDVVLLHIASMSNLFAALGWALVDLVDNPQAQPSVLGGDRARTEQCMLESIRLAQRSIMARYVLAPVEFSDGVTRYDVAPGITIATLLPLTNTTAAPGLDKWNPDRWNRRRLADGSGLAATELVTAFGHGRHTCPAQPFSLAAMTTAVIRLLSRFEFEPGWVGRPGPVPAQIGGVARAADPCPLTYRLR